MNDTLTMDDLQAAPYNPRLIDDAAAAGLSASMEDFGDISGIVWNQRSGHLVCGHQRVEQLRGLGGVMAGERILVGEGLNLVQFPVRVVDWDEPKEKRANIAANNPHIAGVFDDGLDAVLRGIRETNSEDFERLRLDALMVAIPAAPGGGNSSDPDPLSYAVIVDVDSETQQGEVLQEMEGRGFKCRLLIS